MYDIALSKRYALWWLDVLAINADIGQQNQFNQERYVCTRLIVSIPVSTIATMHTNVNTKHRTWKARPMPRPTARPND